MLGRRQPLLGIDVRDDANCLKLHRWSHRTMAAENMDNKRDDGYGQQQVNGADSDMNGQPQY